MRPVPLLLCAACLVSVLRPLAGQDVRYELGLRVRAFETAFEPVCGDPKARAAVCEPLENAVQAFFGVRLAEVARSIDEARRALGPQPVTPAMRWADSITVRVETRLLDVTASALAFRLLAAYAVDDETPADATLRLRLVDLSGDAVLAGPESFAVADLPQRGTLAIERPPPPGDHRLVAEIRVGDATLARSEQTISLVESLEDRLAALQPLARVRRPASMLHATARYLTRQLTALSRGATRETDIDAARHLAEVEQIARALADPDADSPFAADRPGDFRIWLQTPRGTAATRCFVPELEPGERAPVVVALHGAGGSENLFFDAYGAGKIVRLCRERGWFLVAPRAGLGLANPKAADVAAALAETYPVDTDRVFAIGHSMGAATLMSHAGSAPDRHRAIALLGGGGRFSPGEEVRRLPIFLAPGERDFARTNARRLRDALQRAGVEHFDYREYEATEHFGIVQVALADAFRFFDRFVATDDNANRK